MKTRIRYRGAEWDAELILDANLRPSCYQIFGHPAAAPGQAYHLVLASQAEPVSLLGVNVSSPIVAEGALGTTTPMIFTVTLNQPPSQTVTLNYTTQDGTAIANTDYQPASGTIVFMPNETSKNITVNVIGDSTTEPNETLRLIVSAPDNTIPPVQGIGTIVNDDQWTPNQTFGFSDAPIVAWIFDAIDAVEQMFQQRR